MAAAWIDCQEVAGDPPAEIVQSIQSASSASPACWYSSSA